ncbi:MAG TPA: hypothetical protein EYN19_04700, partial [Flavobacteriales bacterium]|nr:hypothetical protein [Flavobacteriales bacterium]
MNPPYSSARSASTVPPVKQWNTPFKLSSFRESISLNNSSQAFRIQVGWAKERGLPIVIHVRDAWEELFNEMDSLNDDSL